MAVPISTPGAACDGLITDLHVYRRLRRSTTCGIKMFRFQVLAANARIQVSRLLRPHAVIVAYYNNRPISEQVIDAVMGFFYLYILCFVVVAGLLGLTGLDLETALSGAATAISNVGPGLGDEIGRQAISKA